MSLLNLAHDIPILYEKHHVSYRFYRPCGLANEAPEVVEVDLRQLRPRAAAGAAHGARAGRFHRACGAWKCSSAPWRSIKIELKPNENPIKIHLNPLKFAENPWKSTKIPWNSVENTRFSLFSSRFPSVFGSVSSPPGTWSFKSSSRRQASATSARQRTPCASSPRTSRLSSVSRTSSDQAPWHIIIIPSTSMSMLYS